MLGTQPTLTHVPPMVLLSIIAVFAPWSAALIAAANAAEPDPRMTKSNIRFDCHMTDSSYKLATSVGWLD